MMRRFISTTESKEQHIRLANALGISTDQSLEDFTTAVIEKISHAKDERIVMELKLNTLQAHIDAVVAKALKILTTNEDAVEQVCGNCADFTMYANHPGTSGQCKEYGMVGFGGRCDQFKR